MDYGEFDDQRVKHLDMIQAVVARLGNNAFLIKGWAVTVAGAFMAFAVNRDEWQLTVASIAPTLLFWILDASFLRNERLFRHLYDRVRERSVEPFFMGATSAPYVERVKNESREDKSARDVSSRLGAFSRPALWLFYGAILTAALVVAVILCRT